MPRRGRSGGMSRAPAPARPPPAAHPPAPAPPAAAAPMAQQPRQPGMFAQMATTAAGVAVGSAVGHTIGHAMTGGGGSQEAAQAPAAAPAAAPVAAPPASAPTPLYPAPANTQNSYSNANPCELQFRQFIECTQTQTDISLCAGFNEALKECKLRYGLQIQ